MFDLFVHVESTERSGNYNTHFTKGAIVWPNLKKKEKKNQREPNTLGVRSNPTFNKFVIVSEPDKETEDGGGCFFSSYKSSRAGEFKSIQSYNDTNGFCVSFGQKQVSELVQILG